MVGSLSRQGHIVNRKRVQRLMRLMGLAGLAPRANDQHQASGAQGLSLPPAGHPGHPAQSGVEHGPHLYPAGTRLPVFGGGDRLVFAPGTRLADQQQHGHLVLHRLVRRCLGAARQAGDRQHTARSSRRRLGWKRCEG